MSETTPEADPPTADTDTSEGVTKTASALLTGISGFMAAITAVGTATGQVGRAFRNHSIWTGAALLLILVAVLCGLLSQIPGIRHRRVLYVVGSIALVVGMGAGLSAVLVTLQLGDRPTIELTTTPTDGGALNIDAHVTIGQAKAADFLVVSAKAWPVTGEENAITLFYSKTGPNVDGEHIQDAHFTVDPGVSRRLVVTAVAYPVSSQTGLLWGHSTDDHPGWQVDCDGYLLDPNGQRAESGERIKEHTAVACVTMDFAP